MSINYYSVIEELQTLAFRMVISFIDKKQAECHAELLNLSSDDKYIVVPSIIELFKKVEL